ncbi:MAG: TetR/AcrR family transcriptional regulator [Clostridia bacterium]|nr:TetR/AcrR family transcriptional regulator [Clostridia bacterium]
MQKKEDRRTCRTKKAIKQAFTQLIIEKDYKEISVTELAELAGINRKTFYSHYECMDDVLDELHEDIVEQLFAIHGKNAREKFDITDFAVTINEMLADNYNLYRRLIVANEYRFFSRKVRDSLKETFIAHYLRDSSLSSEVINFVAEYCVSGLIRIYRVWFDNGSVIEQGELSRLAATLMWGGMQAVLEEKK